MDEPTGPLDEGIVYRATLPLAWEPVAAMPAPEIQSQINETNVALLAMFSVLDEHPVESKGGEPEVIQALARLDTKVSLVLELVGELLRHQLALPKAFPVALSEHGLSWIVEAPSAPAMGDLVRMDIYLKTSYPRPLRCWGEVVSLDPSGRGVKIAARFRGMAEDMRDGLSKLIFRHHRRLIASQRTI
ncbi:hypothetical protein BI364_11390 [Acidihalobacter yilgarnensis]|uniref:Cyclic di-GMP receptor atypical PilZ domain-containing protein n=1 Tax=Acidihalobacter yilgarnensis TaxID=2819280 RepID=A0A1D8IPV8_9GAMM|nr:PilZ domain-containing protein [Acidihalobacter yilgarnensis]AOU98476.1 hypothetical protein BI364_11390 [Acidihalobacter yilgarnensis]